MTIPADHIYLLMQSALRRFDEAQRVFRARIAEQTAGTAKRCSCSPWRPECARCDELTYAWWSKEEPKSSVVVDIRDAAQPGAVEVRTLGALMDDADERVVDDLRAPLLEEPS